MRRPVDEIKAEIVAALGFFPPFFEPALTSADVLDSLWHQTRSCYLENPLPDVFKEKLAALLARFCKVPYCLLCHSSCLRPLGISAQDVLDLLETPIPSFDELNRQTERLVVAGPEHWAAAGSQQESAILACCVAIFLQQDVPQVQAKLRAAIGDLWFNYLALFLGYNRTALNWAELYPEISYQNDKRVIDNLGPLLREQPALATFFRTHQARGLEQAARRDLWLTDENRRLVENERQRIYGYFDQMPVGVCLLEGANHVYAFANERYYGFFGGRCELLGKNIADVLPDFKGSGRLEVLDRVYRSGEPFRAREHAAEILQIDGTTKHFLFDLSYDAMRNASGEVIGISVTAADVSEQVRSRQAIERSELRLRTLSNAMPQIVWEANAEGALTYTNVRWTEYSGSTDPERWLDFVHPDDKGLAVEQWMESVKTGCSYETKFRLLREADQQLRWHLVRAERFFDEENRKWYGTCTDIEDQIQAEKDLAIAKNQAESANAIKSAFLANMSHEIRTPLGAIMGFAELLHQEDQRPEERADCVETIRRNGEHLLSLVNDILDLSKVESGKMELESQRVGLAELVGEVESMLRRKAAAKGLKVSFEADGAVPRYVTTDPTRLKQILINVAGNAVKFTDSGRVTVKCRLVRATQRSDASLVLAVEDTGCGLRPEQVERLFEPFMQADATTTRRYGGTGLGLALSKKLAQALGGDLVLESSVPGRGSTFVIVTPVLAADLTDLVDTLSAAVSGAAGFIRTKTPAVGRLDGMRILVVEDTIDNQRLIGRFLRSAGALVEFASNGVEGAARGLSGHYDVILMDIQMPLLDGYESTRRLRAGWFDGPIIALTAHAMLEEKRRCMDAGCTDILTKPISQSQLLETLSKFAVRSSADNDPDDIEDDILADIMGTFLRETFPELLRQLDEALVEPDWTSLTNNAHILMGSVIVYKERAVGSIARSLEQEAKNGRRMELVRRYIAELRGIFVRLTGVL